MSDRITLIEDDEIDLVDSDVIEMIPDDGVIAILDELVSYAGAPNVAFEFTVNATDSTFTMPLIASGTYNFTIIWDKNGSADTDIITAYDQAEVTHNFGGTGLYLCSVTGTLTGWKFANGGDKLKFTAINNWGVNVFTINDQQAFYGCTNFTTMPTDGTQKPLFTMTNAYRTFRDCNFATVPGCEDWDVSTITSFQEFWYNNTSLNQNIAWTGLNASAANFRSFMRGCTSQNGALPAMTSNQTLFETFAYNCDALEQDLSAWDVTGMTAATNFMLTATGLSTANYDLLLISWGAQAVNSGVSIHFGGSTYTAGGAAAAGRAALVTAGWTIADGGTA